MMKLVEAHNRAYGETLNYLVYTPEVFSRKLPMITFLHGAGERGACIEHLFRHGIPKLIYEKYEYPAIILIPQCHENLVWNNVTVELMALIDKIANKYEADKGRLSVTGGSMGGFGTWEMGMSYTNIFCAIAPICGGGLSWRAKNLKTTPVFAYHGRNDMTVPLIYSTLMVDAVAANGGTVNLTVFENTGHNDAIDRAYRSTDLIQKLLICVRTDFTAVKEAFSEHF